MTADQADRAAAGPADGGPAAAAPVAEHAQPAPDPDRPPGLAQLAQQVLDDVFAVLHARAQLLALETQRAGLALTRMTLYAVVAGLLLVTAWAVLWVLLVTLAVAAGIPLPGVLAAALVLSAGGIWLLLWRLRVESRHLLFPATLRQLAPAASPRVDPDRSAAPAPPADAARPQEARG